MAKKSILFLIFLAACTSHRIVTYSDYAQVKTDEPIASIEEKWGPPYAVRDRKDGSQEYEYIERIEVGNGIVSDNHYILVVRDGKVIGKYLKREQSPAYDLIYQEQPNYPND